MSPSAISIAKKEREILTWFFANIGSELGLVRAGKPLPGAELHGAWEAAQKVLRNRLSSGWTESQVREAFLSAKELKIRSISLAKVLPQLPPTNEDRNLLNHMNECIDQHCHPECLVFVPYIYDDDGYCIDGYIEDIEKYSLGNLLDYYYIRLEPRKLDRGFLTTVLNNFLRNYSLDTILFSIDMWRAGDNSISRGENPWELREWFGEAQKEIEERKR